MPGLRRVGDLSPAQRLQEVPGSESDHRQENEPDLRVFEGGLHLGRIGVANREPEKDCADCDAAESDERSAPRHLHVQFEAVVRELVLVRDRQLARAMREEEALRTGSLEGRDSFVEREMAARFSVELTA